MSTSYHHGDLRRALLEEAASMVDKHGVSGLSLRAIARRVGVSPTASYHHFRDKAALLRALAEEALAELDAVLAEADSAHADPEQRLRAQGVAYVLFAVDRPSRFRLAFQPEIGSPFAGMGEEGAALPDHLTAFRHLVRVIRDLFPHSTAHAPLVVATWSIVHGLSTLLVDGPLRLLAGDRERVRSLAEACMAHLFLNVDGGGAA